MSDDGRTSLGSPSPYIDVKPQYELEFHDSPTTAEACRLDPGLCPALEQLRTRLRIPRTVSEPLGAPFERLTEHYRSVVQTLHAPGGARARGVLAIKGAEPLMDDYPQLVEWMARTTFRGSSNHGHMPMVDHFPLRENKVPGALSLLEAHREAEIAAEIQETHLQHYGELAALPVPLLVHRIGAGLELERVRVTLSRTLTAAAWARTESLLRDGLAVYVYYYPGYPARVRQVARRIGQESERDRAARLERIGAQAAIECWTRTLARMFHLGYMAYTYQNEGLGACFDAGNSCIDGGFVDVDSVVRMATIPGDGMFYDALVATVLGLVRTADAVLPHDCHDETREFFIRLRVLENLSRSLASEGRPGLELDPRLQTLVSAPSHAELVRILHSRRRTEQPYGRSL